MIPAIIQPPSEKLTKLKLFLEKTKTEFSAENLDLMDWIDDRKLQVENLSFTQELQKNSQNFDSVESDLITQVENLQSKDAPLLSSVTKEEYQSIMDKMVQLLQLPAGQLAEESELYLEQQLSDILGFDVVAEYENHRPLFSTGIMKAVPHLKRSPTDTLLNHTNYHEAGINQSRSIFGWFGSGSDLDPAIIAAEKYFITIPLYFDPAWQTDATELKNWYKFRKAIIINPANRVAVVCVIGDIGPNTITRKQFGGSPELIHEGKIWSPQAAGRVLLLFVDDKENSVPLGPIQFDTIFEKNG